MSAIKADYPSRPPKERPKKPGKGIRKPSRTSGGGRRKTWLSLGDKIEGGRDISTRLNFPWWKAPMYREARSRKWA